MRLSLWLDKDAQDALATLTGGRSRGRAKAVREAILLAARLTPITERLDRIEATLAGGVPVVTSAPQEKPNTSDAATDAIRNLSFGRADDKEDD